MRGLNPRRPLSPPNHVIPLAFTHTSVLCQSLGADNLLPGSWLREGKVTPTCIRHRPISIVIPLKSVSSLSCRHDIFLPKNMLYHLSHGPNVMEPAGFEPATVLVPIAFVPATPFKSRSTRSPTPNARPRAFPRGNPQSSRRPGLRIRQRSECHLAPAPAWSHMAEGRCIRGAPVDFAP